MLGDAHFEAALNYFYFLTLDEPVAVQLAIKTIQNLKKKIKSQPQAKIECLLIAELSIQLRRPMHRHFLLSSSLPKKRWKIKHPEVFSKWKEYFRHGDLDFSETLVLKYILKFSVADIAQAIGTPEGTIYFRLGKGLEAFSKLGRP